MIGQRRDRVTFQRHGRTQRADGGYDVAWSTLSTVWAAVRPVGAREREQSGRMTGETSYIIEIDALDRPADLTTDDVIVWDTSPVGAIRLNLRAIRLPTSRALPLELVADAGVNV